MRTLLFSCLMIFSGILVGQKHDNIWQFGYSALNNPEDSLWGTSFIDFNFSPPKIYYDGFKKMDFFLNSTMISSKEGQYLFAGDGDWLENKDNQLIENSIFEPDRDPSVTLQGGLILPIEPDSGKYAYLHAVWDYFRNNVTGNFFAGNELFYSEVDMTQNNGRGKVTTKNKIIILDTLAEGKLTAVKHANGRDWWILQRKAKSNFFYKIKYNLQEFKITEQRIEAPSGTDGVGQACFSPDGAKYVILSKTNSANGIFLDIYDFNRCTGELSNHISKQYPNIEGSGGVAFSPNSKFLYVAVGSKIHQFDLTKNAFLDSGEIVAEYDGFYDEVEFQGGTWRANTNFFAMQLAPNGKIYINSNNATRYLHVIESPNKRGVFCRVKQHSVKLPTLNTSIPNFPNYRLGALENSPCDTLSTTAAKSIETNQKITLYPNPTTGNITIDFKRPTAAAGKFLLYDLAGKKLKSFSFSAGEKAIDFYLNDLARGMYFYKIQVGGFPLKVGKLIIE